MTIEDEVRAAAPQLMGQAEATVAGWSIHSKIYLGLLVLAVLAAFVVWTQWPAPAVPENLTPAPQQPQADGSMQAARAPDAHPAPPPHLIPKGYHEVSRDAVTVAPSAAAAASGCPSVHVDLSVVRDGNDQRVIASSPDGQVVSAINIPIEAAMTPPAPKLWAAGLGYTTQREVGVWVERDVGRLRIGAEVLKGAGAPRAEIRVGVAF